MFWEDLRSLVEREVAVALSEVKRLESGGLRVDRVEIRFAENAQASNVQWCLTVVWNSGAGALAAPGSAVRKKK